MKHYVVMVAGGTGTRMRLTTAKQFLNVEGLPLMWWTLRRFKEALPEAEVALVLHESLFEEFAELEAKHGSAGATHAAAPPCRRSCRAAAPPRRCRSDDTASACRRQNGLE